LLPFAGFAFDAGTAAAFPLSAGLTALATTADALEFLPLALTALAGALAPVLVLETLPVLFFESCLVAFVEVALVEVALVSLDLVAAGFTAPFGFALVFTTGFSIFVLEEVLAVGFFAAVLAPVLVATLLVDLAAAGVDFDAAFLADTAAAFGAAFATGFAELFAGAVLIAGALAADDLAAEVFEEVMALVSLGLEVFASGFEGVEPAKRLESKPLRFLPAFASVEPFANFYLSPPPLNRFSGDSGITKTHVKFLFSRIKTGSSISIALKPH
jgi:hypothetical protein